jgi:hypothetical protein
MAQLHIQLQTSTLRKVLKRLHYPLEVIASTASSGRSGRISVSV